MKETWKFENIDWLVQDGGEITVGEFATYTCVATACDKEECLAMLVRKDGESLNQLLHRLDAAIEDAIDNRIYVDEVNE